MPRRSWWLALGTALVVSLGVLVGWVLQERKESGLDETDVVLAVQWLDQFTAPPRIDRVADSGGGVWGRDVAVG